MSKIKIFSLGGLNENGKNMYVVDVDNNIFIFDAGLKYPSTSMLGVDYIIPKLDYIKENYDRIKGIFISHGHDGNMGAVPDILEMFPDIPVYATKFSMELLKIELEKYKIKAGNLKEVRPHSKINFNDNLIIFPIAMTHVLPEVVSYVLYTDDGAIVYATDFLFDSTMLGPYKTDIGKLAYVGKQGVLCLMSESSYADKVGYTSPKHHIADLVWNTISRAEGRVIITLFANNLYHVQEILESVMKTNRKVVLMGKELQEIVKKAMEFGYLNFDKDRIGDLKNINDKDAVILVSEHRESNFSAIEKILNNYDKYIVLKETDTIFLTELVYSNNEKKFAALLDNIARKNVEVVHLSNKQNLSYHASQQDLMMIINLMNPKYYFPIKGEYRLQYLNATVAEMAGVSKDHIILKQNGDAAIFENGTLEEGNMHIHTDSILIDGKNVDDVGELVLKDRDMLSTNGIVIVTATLDKLSKKVIAGPQIFTRGFIYVKENQEMINKTALICMEVLNEVIVSNQKVDYQKVKNEIRDKLGLFFEKETGSKPMIITVIQEV
ncbi:MAG TPA: ribonuclease J [Bacilli bacterium]|nr:ribonuclease J [Bacilli bacterium]